MPDFKNLKSLEKYLKKQIDKTLKNEVFEKVRDTMQEQIDKTVYDSWTPKIYERRYDNDGLGADENIVGDVNDNVLTVTNIAEPQGRFNRGGMPLNGSLATMIEFGHGVNGWGYDYGDGSEPYSEARPFVKNTIRELEKTKAVSKSLKDGLKRQGIKTD